MVSNPALAYCPTRSPRDFGVLLQSCFTLWFSSLRRCFWPSLIYSALVTLPWLPWWWQTRDRFTTDPWHAWLAPDLFHPDTITLLLGIVANLLALAFIAVVMRRQGLMTRGTDEVPDLSGSVVWRKFPALLTSVLGYAALNLLAMAPVALAAWLGAGSDDLIWRLTLLLAGLLLCAAPLAWVSVAACFCWAPILLDDASGLAGLRDSVRVVRGHWLFAASLISLIVLIWSGLYGTIATAPLALTGMVAFAFEGLPALLRPGWLVWGQLLSVPLMALTLPLLTGGFMECHEELKRRAAC